MNNLPILLIPSSSRIVKTAISGVILTWLVRLDLSSRDIVNDSVSSAIASSTIAIEAQALSRQSVKFMVGRFV